jgi:transcriptional regulator with XRE-family HTH domain
MKNKTLDVSRNPLMIQFRYLVGVARREGVSPTALAGLAGLPASTINRKLNGMDKSLPKPETLARIEEAVRKISKRPLASGGALMAELNTANDDIAHSVEDLVRLLVEQRVISEDKLPAHLRRALTRRKNLLALLDIPD